MIRNAQRKLRKVKYNNEPELILGECEYTGKPVVSLDITTTRSGTRSFDDPALLRKFAKELVEVAEWLEEQPYEG